MKIKTLLIVAGSLSLIVFGMLWLLKSRPSVSDASAISGRDEVQPGKAGKGKAAVTRPQELDPATARIQRLQQIYSKPDKHSEKVAKITDESLPFRERLALVHSLSRQLETDDIHALMRYLKYGENNDNAYVLKNDVLNALRDQTVPPSELTDVMLDLFYDKSQDMTVRCYALQHMRPWFLDERQHDPRIVQAFYDGLKETDTEIAGVALLALRYASEQHTSGEFDAGFIAEQAVAMAENDNTYILSRISAVGVCAKMGTADALPTIRNLAENSSSVTLKVSAIAALGELGNTEDINTLRKLATGKRPYSTAAQAALKKLNIKY